ncbi:EF-hand calcium-binding domain-containing protein 6 isoform X2 [Hemicordylus capensis]|uniref:EF-hand calcium-binding domain-containing protein 6 isoform X2 n=1 Tax=Hemicordylus capensis TaxID=884348 RepID=UPI00230255CF|nr:EF-hand calcium-binding domain-containing protein 6 isoform X2 [Hemicordylus capensis]
MSRVVSASDYSNLFPQSHGIVFNARVQSTSSSRSSTRSSSNSSVQKSFRTISIASFNSVPDPTLTLEDIEQILLQKATAKEDELKKAFQTVDLDQTLKVTKGEFRRVIETFILPLTQEQFDAVLAKIPGTSKVAVPYLEFLSRFAKPLESLSTKWSPLGEHRTRTLNQLECLLREKISKKLKHFIKTCRLFDYNQNGEIQRHELRRILEVNCFKMTDCEYDKLWNRYCICRTNTLNYKEFLQYLGINLDKKKKRITESRDSENQNEPPGRIKSQSMLPAPTTPGYNLTKIHLDATAKEFRVKLRAVYEDLVKAFRAFDVGRSGFVSLEYLKSVLNTFIFPIRSDVFQDLMNRFGIKISKNMAWERFLDKFQDPIMFDSGQASSTGKRHRSRKLDEALSSDRILLKLHGHIQDAYSSLKKAFLMLDRNQDGKITRNELRRILDCIMFRISDDDFQELIKIIDPEHTGHLSYNEFLNLFEDKDSVTDSKWMNGTKKAKKPSSVLEAWKIAEDVLTEQVKGYWNEFNKALQACDPRSTGIISRNNFRKVLLLYCPSLTDDHFIALYQKYQDDTTEGVLYRMLLHSLGVADLPKELTALASTPPSQGSRQREEKKEMDFSERMKQIEDHAYKYTKNRTVDEVIERLRDGILQPEASLRDGFLVYNKQANGKLSKTDFRKLLEDIGISMEDDQFNLLLEKLGFPSGGLSYLDFVAVFEDSRLLGRRVNTNRCHFMSAEECLGQFSNKLVEEYGDPYIAFRKIDRNNDGVVTMLDFRRLLDSFMISMTDEEYVRLLGILGMNEISTLNYPEFLQLFQAHATKEMRPWLTPLYKPKQIAADADLACEQAHYYLTIKAQSRWNDLAMFFHEYDSDGNGIVLKKDLKDVLYRFGIPINPKDFEKLWARYDLNAKGYLTHQEFLQKMGAEYTPPETCLRFMDNNKKVEKKHVDITEIINKIREKYRESSQDFHKAFLHQDKNREGYITVDNLRKMLEDFHCLLGYEQYSELLYSLGIDIQDNKLSYFDFLRIIDDRAAFRQRRRRTMPPVPPISFVQLSIDEAMKKIKQIVTASSDLLYKAFSTFDKEHTGAISVLDFRQVLHHFCFTLSEKQFNHLLKLQRLRGEHSIDWKYFLQKFNFLSETEREHAKFACRELSNQEVSDRIQEVVSARFQAIEQEFKNADSTKEKLVSKKVFRDICNQRFMLLTDEQFENLWNVVPLDLNGKLKYPEFLRMFSSEAAEMPDAACANHPDGPSKPVTPAEPASRLPSRPKTAASPSPPKKTPSASRPCTAAVQTLPILNSKPIESKIRKTIQHSWKDMLKECREKDVDRLGEILVEDFLAILEKFHLNLTKEEIQQLITKYDYKSVGRFAYCDFLQSCVLLFKHQELSPLQRVVIQDPRGQKPTGPQTPTFFNAMMRIQPQILHCWRPMRRTFKFYDDSRSGLLSIQDFRQVLRKYGINLSEEEFFHILEYYDKTLTSKISYNEFLRAFLQ